MKYRCKVCGGICDPGELAGGICFECRREDTVQKNLKQPILEQDDQPSSVQGGMMERQQLLRK